MVSRDPEKIEELLTRGVENIYPSADFLRSRLMSGERLTIYLGADPTAPTLHVGHTIPLRKLKAFQELGHRVVFLVGDYTATIGDPDKMSMREPLTHEQVLENAKLYKSQAAYFLNFEGENPAELKYNSEWLAKLSFAETLTLASHITHAQLIKRDMFQKRIAEGKDLGLHEFLYPLMQGYDSLAMNVDGEVGGNDQMFNMMTGRDLMKKVTGKEKFVITTKLLVDSDGAKMGKTTGNMLALTDTAEDMFGKVMSWTDSMIIPGFELCTDVSTDEIEEIARALAEGASPLEKKLYLAEKVVEAYYGPEGAEKGHARFKSVVQNKEIPDEISEITVDSGMLLSEVAVEAGLVKSKSDYRRLLEESAIRNLETDEVIENLHQVVEVPLALKVGKRRFLKILVR